ncbi:uncharacterized protein LOC134240139 [Saccostrea cucullata]|uniref:uncharacterized protein LOC134240139 n=1 Tax=Saccostrea cuccullata TaxID=36930 RepID=UPI002ED0FB0A
MLFVARQLQEKCQEQNSDLYSTYVDLTKAFDTVSRKRLWQIMAKYDVQQNSSPLFDNCTMGCRRESEMAAKFQSHSVSSGVKQSCVLAPTLFNLMFSAMLTDASMARTLELASNGALIAQSSTSDIYK